MGKVVHIRTKADYDRNATPTRILAARFYIWCLEDALTRGTFPRDHSLWKVEYEFRPGNWFGKNLGHSRQPLLERLARIHGRIVFGRRSRDKEIASNVAVDVWMNKPEIKVMLAEKVLTGDA